MYIVLFEDEPAKAAERLRLMPEHLAFLERNAATIRAAGPLREPVGGAAAGGLWLVDGAELGQVDRLCREDPFWPTGLRRSVRILEWRRVFADGRRIMSAGDSAP